MTSVQPPPNATAEPQASTLTGADIVRLVQSRRLSLSDEKATQADLECALTEAGIPFEREKRLSAADIVDFLVDGRIAVECKLRGNQKMAVFKQLRRYAGLATVQELVLVTNLSMGLPPAIEGKPAYYASLGRAWL